MDVSSRAIWLQIAVAQASATATSGEKTVTASAMPRLMDGPTVAEDVQIPRISSCGGSRNAKRPLKGDSPANMPIRISRSLTRAISPPLSMRPNAAPASTIVSTPAQAMAPATAAMGPTPASPAARAMRPTVLPGHSGTYGSSVTEK